MPHKYSIIIFYRYEDEGFIAVVPELPGCSRSARSRRRRCRK